MGSDKKANFTVTLSDFMSGGLGKISASLAVLRQGFGAVADVVRTAISIFQNIMGEYAAQETAVNKLNIALKNQGIVSQQVTSDYVDFANKMQDTTVFADEQVIEMQALLATFGVVGESMKTTLKASADLATGLGIDLRTATMMLGKAALGETGTLSRYGIVIADNIPKAQKFAEVQKQVTERFGGSASAAAETYAGKMAILGNKFSDLKESIALVFLPAANLYTSWLQSSFDWIGKLIGQTERLSTSQMTYTQKVSEGLTETIAKQKAYLEELKKERGLDTSSKLYQEEAAKYGALVKAKIDFDRKHKAELDALNADVKGKGPTAEIDTDAKKKAEDRQASIMQEAQNEIDTLSLSEAEKNQIKVMAQAQELEQMGQHEMAKQLLKANADNADSIAKKKKEDEDKKFNENRAKNLLSTLQTISTLSNNHNKTLATIGKAAAISTATIDTFAAANKALASAPPPWNFGLAALVTAAGMANVAQISGMKLAEGGMVMPRNGGTVATMGEVGKAEVAIPLDDERTKEKLRDTLGGGGLTVVINAGTLIADDYSVDQFAQKIDEKLFELQRNGRSYR